MIGDEDLDACFNTDDFGIEADFGGSTGSVKGHFTDATEATLLYGVEIEARDPSFACKTSDITAVRNKDSVTIDGTDYTVAKIQKLGTGVSLVTLKT